MKSDIELILELISADGVALDRLSVVERAKEYLSLIGEWNAYASLVSTQDAESGLESHLLDSWTLVPWIAANVDLGAAEYLDLGSGGGFPAIPICLLLGGLQTTLVERNEKKTVFLKKAIRRLGLGNVKVENRSFDGGELRGPARVITSRAIEKPHEVIPVILGCMREVDVYLCQSPAIWEAGLGAEFSCEAVTDHYAEEGLRRSTLYVVRRV